MESGERAVGAGAGPAARDIADVAIVIPAWNEHENLQQLLPALREVLVGLGLRAQIIVVDGGSTDRTPETAHRLGARVITQAEPGYAAALAAGVAMTRAPYIITMDADLSPPPSFIEALWRHRDEAEVLIASRYAEGGRAEIGPVRRWLSVTLNRVVARVLATPYHDLTSGFRMYRREVLADLSLTSRGFDVLQEILIRGGAEGWRVREAPFHYMARGAGSSPIRLIRFGWAYLTALVRLWRVRNATDGADYDYRAWDSPIWLQRYWHRTRHRILLDFVRECEAVLDVGCGSSRTILDLPRAVGLDIRPNVLRWLSRRRGRLVLAACQELPFADGSFDALIHSRVIERQLDDPEILEECHRVLRPGGVLALATPDYGRPLCRVLAWIGARLGPSRSRHFTRFTHAELTERLTDAGFEILDCQYVGGCEMIFKARRP
jgi:dolichol-phosphate mannosyltransferase